MNDKDNKTFFEDLSKEQQEEFYNACNRYFGTISKVTFDGKELTKLKEKGEKLFKIYDILYDLYVDDTDCTQCGYYTGFCLLEKQCAYHEHFMADEVVKEFLTKKAKEIHEIATK